METGLEHGLQRHVIGPEGGAATLGGSLTVYLANNYQPAGAAKSWTLLYYSSLVRPFDYVFPPAPQNGSFAQPTYAQTSMIITWNP